MFACQLKRYKFAFKVFLSSFTFALKNTEYLEIVAMDLSVRNTKCMIFSGDKPMAQRRGGYSALKISPRAKEEYSNLLIYKSLVNQIMRFFK